MTDWMLGFATGVAVTVVAGFVLQLTIRLINMLWYNVVRYVKLRR